MCFVIKIGNKVTEVNAFLFFVRILLTVSVTFKKRVFVVGNINTKDFIHHPIQGKIKTLGAVFIKINISQTKYLSPERTIPLTVYKIFNMCMHVCFCVL